MYRNLASLTHPPCNTRPFLSSFGKQTHLEMADLSFPAVASRKISLEWTSKYMLLTYSWLSPFVGDL